MLLLSVHLSLAVAFAQSDTTRVFSVNNPLIYEDVWDLWPYSFLNDNGDPDGFNVDLIRLIMKELDIPYVIRLKPSSEAFRDLKEGIPRRVWKILEKCCHTLNPKRGDTEE